VFDANGLVGALTLTMPVERLVQSYAKPVLEAAKRLTGMLGGKFPDTPQALR
jgi:DNA-binding IclR family transcriptional regulator